MGEVAIVRFCCRNAEMEQPRTERNFGEQQRGNVESQSLDLPIRARFPGT